MKTDLTRLDMVVNVRFPGVKAHGIQIAAMAEALADTGLIVDVVVPRRFPYRAVDAWEHYGVRRNFKICRIANIDTIDMVKPSAQRFPFLMQSVTFGLRALSRAAVDRSVGLLVRDHYTAEILVGGLRAADRRRLAAEIHSLPELRARRLQVVKVLRKLRAVVVISEGLKDDLVEEGLDPSNILVARDGVHLERFENMPDVAEARSHLALEDRPTVVYAGQLYEWKGVDVLVEAVGRLPGVQLLVVGGDRQNLPRVEALGQKHAPGQVIFTGNVSHQAVPFYLAAGDVVALPNSARERISRKYTSPLKLFEAMASRRAIVASDLPSLGEVLRHDSNAYLVAPDDPTALAEGIDQLLQDEALRTRLSEQAKLDVQPFNWSERGRRVANFLRGRLVVGAGWS
ncbi:MAG: glycosyltransferase family 4 protein [Planctomycetota bacterium]|nr:glycosyltransferase family 4 protein [Planctomycetota bacterium]